MINWRDLSFLTLFLTSSTLGIKAEDEKVVVTRLEGKWRFSLNDKSDWAQADFDDSQWDFIKVPAAWEDQGFPGYDGYAWYRSSVNINKELKSKDLFLSLGYIDDVDQVYFNGKLIGFSGKFPPEYSTALEAKRKYPIPDDYINYNGHNVIAVRVYNHQMAGGIISGDIKLFYYKTIKPDLPLNGIWQFRVGDNKNWKTTNFKDKDWKKIVVPGNWENQGFKGYSGTAWYRKYFMLPEELAGQSLLLMLGNIAESDEIYVNGKLINQPQKPGNSDDVRKSRTFQIPEDVLLTDKRNCIAIKIGKFEPNGGITEGPVGVIGKKN